MEAKPKGRCLSEISKKSYSVELQVKQGIDVISNLIGDPGKERIANHQFLKSSGSFAWIPTKVGMTNCAKGHGKK